MIGLCGAALGVAALLLLRYYFAYLKARCDECVGFLSFLSELERGMWRSLESPSAAARRVDEPRLRASGFLDYLSEGLSPSEALKRASDRLVIPADARRVLAEYFAVAGEGYLENELKSLGRAMAELEKIAARERDEIGRRGRVAGVLLFALTAGVVLLFM